MGRRKKITKRKLAQPKLPMQQQLNLHHEGTHFDLRAIFNDLNQRHFRNRVRGYKVIWGRRRKHRPKECFVFGTIQEEDRVIRINPALDQPFVPPWFLQYVLFHEMLHAVVPDEPLRGGRRRVHTDEFNRREREFRGYHRARRWEENNLGKFPHWLVCRVPQPSRLRLSVNINAAPYGRLDPFQTTTASSLRSS